MRVVNDKTKESQPQAPADKSVFSILIYTLYCAFGIKTAFLGPIPAIGAHLRLADPWNKLTLLMGALVALYFFQTPMAIVVVSFALSLFVGDSARQGLSFWKVAARSVLLVGILSLALVVFYSSGDNATPVAYWTAMVDSLLAVLKTSAQVVETFQWEAFRAILLYEGPFLILSAVLLSVWISVGFAAHLGWFPAGHPLERQFLQQVRLPVWMSHLFILLFVGMWLVKGKEQHLLGGPFRILGSLLFIQGCGFLSTVMDRLAVNRFLRALIYGLSVAVGFYAIVGMGVLRPWIDRFRGQPTDPPVSFTKGENQ